MTFAEQLGTRLLLADGDTRGMLIAAGFDADCMEAACLDEPERLGAIHLQFAEAGIDVIRTNTAGANAANLGLHGLDGHVNEINWKSAQIARQAAKGHPTHVAGVVGPIARAHESLSGVGELFREQMGALLDGGAQLISLEGFERLDELLVALEVKYSLHHCPAICSLRFDETGRLAEGTPIEEASKILAANDADVIGIHSDSDPAPLVSRAKSSLPVAVCVSATQPADAFAGQCDELSRCGAAILIFGKGILPAHLELVARSLGRGNPEAD